LGTESVYAMSVFGLYRNGLAVVLSEGWWCFYPGSKLDLKFCDLYNQWWYMIYIWRILLA